MHANEGWEVDVRARSLVTVLLAGVLVAACGSNTTHAALNPSAGASTSASSASQSATSASVATTPASAAGPTPAAGMPTGSPSAVASPVGLAAGQVGTRSQVPWDQIGPGWFLVLKDTSAPVSHEESAPPAPKGGTTTLSLLSPDGAWYAITSWPSDPEGSSVMGRASLVAWSGDGRHALFSDQFDGIAIEMDLTTGVRNQITVPHLISIGYTSPTGANLVAVQDISTSDGTETGQKLVRFDLNGKPQVQLAEVQRAELDWLYSKDGTTVYLNGPGGLRVVSNAGGPIRALTTLETSDADCVPVSWWDQHAILASCTDAAGSRLWLVPVTGGSATPLTAVPGSESVGLGYDNAVRLGGTVFAQHLEGCGVVTVHRLAPSGVGTRIAIPQSLSNDHLIGAVGSRLAIVSSTECGSPSWFGFYDPARNTTQKIVPDVPGEVGLVGVLPFP